MMVNWGEVAEQLFLGELPAAPVTYSGLLAQRATDPEVALASLRAVSPWSEAPHTLDDFDQSLAAWSAPEHLAWHFVKFEHEWAGVAAVASCYDCGRPVWRAGDDQPWIPIWPLDGVDLVTEVVTELTNVAPPENVWEEHYEVEQTREWATARRRGLDALVTVTGLQRMHLAAASADLYKRLDAAERELAADSREDGYP